MYPELVMLASSVVTAGLSYYLYRETKRVSDLAIRAEDFARVHCKDSAMHSRASENARLETVASMEISNDAATRAAASLKGTVNAGATVIERANEAMLRAAGHAAVADDYAGRSEAYSMTARCNADEARVHAESAKAHSDVSAEHRLACHNHSMNASGFAITAAAHSEVAGNHARSTGALSTAIADIAAQTKVRLVHRTDYSADGSNIGGR